MMPTLRGRYNATVEEPPQITAAGLLYTEEELGKWVEQLENGRYVVTGDVGRTYSPDDWGRAIFDANRLKNNALGSDRYAGPEGTGIVQPYFATLPNFKGHRIMSAAFVGRVFEKQSAGSGMVYV